jgi:ankyrin repeat protein
MPPELELIVNHNRELTDAGRRGDLERLHTLLAGGADVNARDKYDSTTLHAAASWNDLAVAGLLLDHGADLHARDWEGDTPLHIAAAFGNRAVSGLLLDRGADINARNGSGWTPLHLAARLDRAEEVAFLVHRGADAGARDQDGRTPLDSALSNSLLDERREQIGRLLGEARSSHEPRQSLPSPGELAEDRGRPDMPGPDRGPEKSRGR